jgi:hypothetical protein
MSTLREAAQQALEALNDCVLDVDDDCGDPHCDDCERWRPVWAALDVLGPLLEQPEQEPAAWMYVGIKHDGTTHGPHLVWKPQYMDAMSASKGAKATPLYTHLPSREWQSLTDAEIAAALPHEPGDLDFVCARAIEAALKENNHG